MFIEILIVKNTLFEKFKKLKMVFGSFNIFYSKFIELAIKLEFTKERLL